MSTDERPDWRDRTRWPDPAEDSGGPTRWVPAAQDYASPPTGASTWMPPSGVPSGLPPAVEPVTERVGWLTRGSTR